MAQWDFSWVYYAPQSKGHDQGTQGLPWKHMLTCLLCENRLLFKWQRRTAIVMSTRKEYPKSRSINRYGRKYECERGFLGKCMRSLCGFVCKTKIFVKFEIDLYGKKNRGIINFSNLQYCLVLSIILRHIVPRIHWNDELFIQGNCCHFLELLSMLKKWRS